MWSEKTTYSWVILWREQFNGIRLRGIIRPGCRKIRSENNFIIYRWSVVKCMGMWCVVLIIFAHRSTVFWELRWVAKAYISYTAVTVLTEMLSLFLQAVSRVYKLLSPSGKSVSTLASTLLAYLLLTAVINQWPLMKTAAWNLFPGYSGGIEETMRWRNKPWTPFYESMSEVK
jgi:hypothetical protein